MFTISFEESKLAIFLAGLSRLVPISNGLDWFREESFFADENSPEKITMNRIGNMLAAGEEDAEVGDNSSFFRISNLVRRTLSCEPVLFWSGLLFNFSR